MLQSYLNLFRVLQTSTDANNNLIFRLKIKVVNDEDVLQKVLQLTKDSRTKAMINATNGGRATNLTSPAVHFIPMRVAGRSGAGANAVDASCDDNLCFNGGYCDPITQKCRCKGHFIGEFFKTNS